MRKKILEPEPWFVRVRIRLGRDARTCLIGPVESWSDARGLAQTWEREFGAGTTDLASGRQPSAFRIVDAGPALIPASSPPVY